MKLEMDAQTKNQSIAAIIILALCCLAIFLFGCSENPASIGPNDNQSAVIKDGSTSTGDNQDPVSFDTVFVAADTAAKLVDPDGDCIILHIQGKKVEFKVPAGAVADTVTISIIGSRYLVGKNTELYTYECGPSGLQFAVPLELTQKINKSDGAQATLSYYDDSLVDGDGIGWETIGVSHVQGGKGVFLLSHFSKYGVSYALSNGGQNGDIVIESNLN